ncbi:MAG TPA: adenylate/guanylate cyclase domain-containing protein, partial [Spirochaetia bacterium]|nr:adenylate/guanylate cyclase domain-containing protein [Spirochaetia bacterium]
LVSSGKAAAATLIPGVGSIPIIALVFTPLGLPLDAFMVIFMAVGFLAEPFLVLFDVQTNIAAFILIARKTLPALELEGARKKFRISIRASLVALLTVLILMTGLVMIGLMYSGSRRSAYYLADSMIKEISARVEQRTLNYFLPAEKSARRLKFLLENNLVDLDDRERLLTIMRDDVSVNPEFASVYFADLDGNFYMVKRMPDSSLSYRTITRTDSEVIVHWVHSNPENREGFRDSVESLEQGYDPRKRGWYRDAVKANSLIWTDVYIFASDNMPGISCAIPISDVRGKLAGVISVDIGIAELSYFLGSLNISEQGKVFILNRKNKLIAFSVGQKAEIEALVRSGGEGDRTGTIDFVTADEAPDDLIRRSFLEYGKAEKKNEFFSFKGKGESFLSVYTSFAPKEYFNWTIGIILPEEQIMGYVNRTNSVVLLAAVVFVLAALGFGVSFSRAISEPLKRLARGMERIRNYDLTHTESIESSITEVGNMVESFENMKKGLRAFNKYVPAKLVAQLIRLGKEPRIGGQTKRLTIFFSDIAGFTSISEGLTPEKLVDHMAVYFSYLSDTIIKNRGTVDKFIGDAIMAFWNAPMDVPDHGAAACYSALEFQQLLAALKKKYSNEGLSIFQAQTRIGIHTGKVIVGNMGSDERLNYTIIGDSVNLASRLEGLNKYYGTSIIISEETYREAADQIAARLLDRVAVKGKRKGIQIYELAGKRQNVEPVMDSFLSLATRSVESYFGRQWKQAVDLIGQALDLKPKDPALGIILQRCEAFQENPPGRDWDGVFIHHEK